VNRQYPELEKRLGHTFHDAALLARALTHRSRGADNNERLEFLGDSILNLVVSAHLYEQYPQLDEGALTRLRASLVNKPALASLARELELGRFLLLGEGELKSGGYDRDSILADTLEAVIGAVYRDAGLDATQCIVLTMLNTKLGALDPRAVPKDPKTQLQEWLQKRGLPTPEYRVTGISGEAHNQRFVVECRVAGLGEATTGAGGSRRIAEQEAAARALEQLAGPV
jgi:ribonuclease-3